MGGDLLRPSSLMSLTRNVAGNCKHGHGAESQTSNYQYVGIGNRRTKWRDRLGIDLSHASSGKWAVQAEADNANKKKYLMSGLDDAQGNFSLADGSVVQGTDGDLQAAISAYGTSEAGVSSAPNYQVSRPTRQ